MDSKLRYAPKDATIIQEHRYEGMSNPSDLSLLYVIETSDGGKGTMLASYGSNGNNSIHEFMNAVPNENVKTENIKPPDAKQ